ncbi:MAG: hypothetical protein GFH27_549323n43 [Chloroflexi bacterium AL-W]|nr:hypothetical protein [Chloroflexi bacterium AL-N1]NOK70194.1 hypothetical protein [Chloroflexi bacterium AL-N10]NOK77731.1 hypothetical protein [Chloroflexi bacterium AL-N5]NOK84740.1 hypothetical protein [Chloroflexi bacterium AL-W]NOK93197.1 hypothetical protein [Chloroflexi bacterium AL-N15]
MKIRTWRMLAALLLTFLVVFVTPLSTMAQTHTASVQEEIQQAELDRQIEEQLKLQKEYERAIVLMEQHLNVQFDGTFTLDVPNGAAIGVDEQIFNDLYQAMQNTNASIQAGVVSPAEVSMHTFSTSIDEPTSIDACSGRTGVDFFWWGQRVYLDSCNTQAITDTAKGVGATVGGLCAVLSGMPGVNVPGLPTCVVAAAILAIGGFVIDGIHTAGGRNGIYIDNIIGPVPPYIWHQ